MAILTVQHVTSYHYKSPVAFGPHRMMFRPRDSFDQTLLEARLSISPAPSNIRWIHDTFGNCVTIAEFNAAKSDTLTFETNIRLDHTPSAGPNLEIEGFAKRYPFSYVDDEMPDLLPVLAPAFPDPDRILHNWVSRFFRSGDVVDTGRLLMTLTSAIKETFVYERRLETGTRPPALTLTLGRGSCRDLALLMIEALRLLGLAARFVTGYLHHRGREDHVYRGGGSTHAWCEVYLPGAGWIELDPTNAIVGNHDLIRVAVARHPGQAVPLWGSFYGNKDEFLKMSVDVLVRPVSN